jgi:integrase
VTKRRSRGDGAVYFDAANNTWIGALDLGRDATGVRRRLKVSGRTKTIALARLRELAHRIAAGDTPTHDKITVRQAVDDYLDRGLSSRLASNTRYLTTLYARRLADICGGLPLRSLTTRHVEDFLAELADEGKSDRPHRRPVHHRQSARPDADLQALITAAGTDRWAPLLATVIVTGCRIDEAIAQPWTGIDPDHHVVHITNSARHEADGAGITSRDPKARSTRRVKIPPALTQQLRRHRAFIIEESQAAGRPAPDLAFPTSAGTMANRRNLDRWLDKIATAAGIRVKGWHDFRHALATALGDDGTPITQTAAVLGHRNIDTTGRVYTHPTIAADAASQRGERLLTPPAAQRKAHAKRPESARS